MTKKISIIIVTYNSQEYLDQCLQSIGDHLDLPAEEVEVVIVDNSSGKDAAEIKTISESHSVNKKVDIKYVQNIANLGYGQGNNVGIKASSGEVICIMNPDVRFLEPLLKDTLQEFQNTDLAMLAYRQTGGFNYSFYTNPELKTPISIWQLKLANKFDWFNPEKHYLSGAFFFLDRKKFEEIGLFDEKIFMYFEEPDITKRLQQKSGVIKWKKNKKYLHLVGDRISFSDRSFRSEIKSLQYYLQKFKFDEKKVAQHYLTEYRLKVALAKILGDKIRVDNFKKEVKMIKSIFNHH